MKSSSARQLEFDYSGAESVDRERGVVSAEGLSSEGLGASSTPIRIPNFDTHAEVFAITSRMAGRLNATAVSEDEHKALLRERQRLLDKKLAGAITRSESNRLEYVRWSLDRIEDAKYGYVFDALENNISGYERFLEEVRGFEGQLRQHLKKKRRSTP